MIWWGLVWFLLDLEWILVRVPLVGIALDRLLGSAEDFEFVSKTTPVEHFSHA